MELLPVGTLSKGSNNEKIDDTHFSFREKIFLRNQKSSMNECSPLCVCWYKNNNRKSQLRMAPKPLFPFVIWWNICWTLPQDMVSGTISYNHHSKPIKFHPHHHHLLHHFYNQHLHLQGNRRRIVESYWK